VKDPKPEEVNKHFRVNREMFDTIAHKYDFLNHLLSLGIDIYWRKRAVSSFTDLNTRSAIADVCGGTGDLSFTLLKNKIFKGKIFVIDASEEMLKICRSKAQRKGKMQSICPVLADALELPMRDDEVSGVMIAFGIRNIVNVDKALREFHRIIKREGELIILEFSLPERGLFALLYKIYFNGILPGIGKLISRNRSAYSYLPSSVNRFDKEISLDKSLSEAGFKQINNRRMTGGIVNLFYAVKN
jgi:demethylmenaquinone methyltransferase/2-methoxy-6-polyprenyl-1,4-benzoquinol methylase